MLRAMRARLLLLALLGLLPLQIVHAATTVEVLETFPAGNSLRLPAGQNYSLRLHYETDTNTRLWVRPYLRGKPANAGSNPSLTYAAGTGEALGWFFLMEPGDAVDEIRIQGGDGSQGGTQVLLSIPVNIVAVPAGGAAPAQPSWVEDMRAAEAERRAQETNQAMQDTPGGAGIAFALMGIMLVLLVVAVAWPIRALRRWEGGWRIASMLPLGVIGFVVLRIVIGTAIDPTSHNLWPFEVAMAGLVSVGAMVLLSAMRWMQGVR